MTKKELRAKMIYNIISTWRCANFHLEAGREDMHKQMMAQVHGVLEFARELGFQPRELTSEALDKYKEERGIA
jgi:hypothetical protein